MNTANGSAWRRIPPGVAALYVLVHVSFKLLYYPEYNIGNDGPSFIEPATLLLESFSFGEMIWRTPVYPIFLAAHQFIFSSENWLFAVCYTQILLCALALFLLTRILVVEGLKPGLAIAFGVIITFNPATFYYENEIVSEAPSFFWVAVFAWSAWRAHRDNSISKILTMALVAGIGPLLRPEYIVISFLLIVYLASLRAARKINLSTVRGLSAVALLAIAPSLFWAVRNYVIFSFFGLTIGAGAPLFFHTYQHIEAGRTPYNAPAVDAALVLVRRENNPIFVFNAEPWDKGVEQRIIYWKMITDAALRTIIARPKAYLKSVLKAIVGMTYPALGRRQLALFQGWGPVEYRIYHVAHFLLFGLALVSCLCFMLRLKFKFWKLKLNGLYVVFATSVVASDYLLTCLLINGPNNRYRMPFDALILVIGLLSFVHFRKAVRI